MAKVVKFLKGEPHFNALLVLSIAINGDTVAATPTRVTVASDEGHTVVFRGNFTVAGLAVTGGTMTGFDVYAGSTKVMKARGYATPVDAMGDAIEAGLGDFITLVFSSAKIVGSKATDNIFTAPNSKVIAGDGNDRIFIFDPGPVVMKGGDGDDVMSGNGMARMLGGEGNDIFAFNFTGGSDRAKDFSVKDDVVGLEFGMFSVDVPVGYLDASHFRVGSAAQTPTEVVLYDKKTGALLVDPDGSGALAPFQAGILPDHLKLKANDILIGFFT